MINFFQSANFCLDVFPSTLAISEPLWLVNFDGYLDGWVTNTLSKIDYGCPSSTKFFGKDKFFI